MREAALAKNTNRRSKAGSNARPAGRPASVALDRLLLKELRVLDHGFIRVVDYMGNDAAIVQAARVSYGRGTKKVNEDRALIRYLMRNSHTSPFEMAEIKLHVKLPIFVARQWIRHRTANVNEYSARYSILDDEFYIPQLEYLGEQSASNRQGRGSNLAEAEATYVLEALKEDASRSYATYLDLLNQTPSGGIKDEGRTGLARELARMSLSLNFYTQWYWKIDLHNLMHFLKLRANPHAQYEIRAYAEVLLGVLQRWVPLTYEAFLDYQLQGFALSHSALLVVRKRLAGEQITREESGLTLTEWRELHDVLGLPDTAE